ncbi:TonB-dependent receptor plug domain-containing protein [Congregibacter sp.]|uniref:TonB-dependent receptor plug domain-containing protein n=1 Tax=Congregibacter sp. TaxID=2744308 RepID=UPI003F6A53C7
MDLSAYLAKARAAGINIIYASSVITPSQTLDIDEDAVFSLDALRDYLQNFDLVLEELSADTFLLRPQSPPSSALQPSSAPPEERAAPVLEEIIVHSSVYQWTRRSEGGVYLSGGELVRRPVLANDALRVVNQLPGSASVGVSVRPRVRGGSEDETLIEFDRVRVYNPFHYESYNSLYSAFDERLVAELEFYSGAYPMNFGDSLSAAMSITPPLGEEQENRRELGLGLYQLSYFHSAVSEDDAFLGTVRRSGPEAGHLLDEDTLGHPEFADAFLRYERARKDGSTWSANLLWYGDDLSLGGGDQGESAESSYQSGYAWASLRGAPDAALQIDSIFGVGYLQNSRIGDVNQPGKVVGALRDDLNLVTVFANQDYQWGTDGAQYSLGWDYRYMDASFDTATTLDIAPAFRGLSNIDREEPAFYRGAQHVHNAAVYLGWKQRVTSQFYIDMGLRLDGQRYTDRGDSELSYRLGILYQVLPELDVRLAVGRYSQAQALNELPVADRSFFVPAPQVAQQVVVALDWTLPVLGADLQIEVYEKDAQTVTPYYDNLSNAFTLLPELQPDRVLVEADRYRARGAELSLAVPLRVGQLWLNYAYSSADDGIRGGYIPRGWDQGKTWNAGYQTTLGEWELAVSGSFHEGWLATPLFLSGDRVLAGPRNSERFDHYLSLDMKAIRRWVWGGNELRLEVGINNLGNRENAVGIDYSLGEKSTLLRAPFYASPRTAVLDLYWAF